MAKANAYTLTQKAHFDPFDYWQWRIGTAYRAKKFLRDVAQPLSTVWNEREAKSEKDLLAKDSWSPKDLELHQKFMKARKAEGGGDEGREFAGAMEYLPTEQYMQIDGISGGPVRHIGANGYVQEGTNGDDEFEEEGLDDAMLQAAMEMDGV